MFFSLRRCAVHQGQLISGFLPDTESHEEVFCAHCASSVLPLLRPSTRGPCPKAKEATVAPEPQSALSPGGSRHHRPLQPADRALCQPQEPLQEVFLCPLQVQLCATTKQNLLCPTRHTMPLAGGLLPDQQGDTREN